jgi:crotonobetainyl-CoA:carnitine CoA-transferase CaiB-like acyl-CoA transferase
MMLADMGAEVLKIDTPPQAEVKGAGYRVFTQKEIREAALNFVNRNKRSIAINLRAKEGQQILHKLAQETDVVVEGFRPGVMKRLGGDYDTLKQINPRLIYCSLSGYGQDGPYSQLPGHDVNYISLGGALDLIGEPDRPPAIPLNIIADYASAALHGVIGILLSLLARERTGKGQYVDISYLDGVISLVAAVPGMRTSLGEGPIPRRGESALSGCYPYYAVYKTKDGKYISIGCLEPWLWENLCRALGREDLITYHFVPQHFTSKPDGSYTKVFNELKEIFLTKTREEWFDFLSQHDVCVGKVYSWDEVFTDPQVLHRHMLVEVGHPEIGKVKQIGIAIKLSETPGSIRSLGPYLGQHTDEVLAKLGYSSQDIAQLRQKGVVA